MKLLYFILGVIAGIVGVELYGIYAKPVMPSENGWMGKAECDARVAKLTKQTPYDPDDTQPVKVR